MSVAPRGHIDPKTGEFKIESFDLVHDQSLDPSSLSVTWAAGHGPEPSVVDRVASIENPELAQKIAEWDEKKRAIDELVTRGKAEAKKIYDALAEKLRARRSFSANNIEFKATIERTWGDGQA